MLEYYQIVIGDSISLHIEVGGKLVKVHDFLFSSDFTKVAKKPKPKDKTKKLHVPDLDSVEELIEKGFNGIVLSKNIEKLNFSNLENSLLGSTSRKVQITIDQNSPNTKDRVSEPSTLGNDREARKKSSV